MIKFYIIDKNNPAKTIAKSTGTLELDNTNTGKIYIESNQELALLFLAIGPGSKTYVVKTKANLVTDITSPIWGTIDITNKANTDETIYKRSWDSVEIYKGLVIELTNSNGNNQVYYYNLYAHYGASIPIRKY